VRPVVDRFDEIRFVFLDEGLRRTFAAAAETVRNGLSKPEP
jgi:hypothetical protein